MAILTLTGEDTLTLGGNTFTDLADGDAVTVAFPNEDVVLKTGKNGNTIYAKNDTGANADVTIRVMMGSRDDRFLASKKAEQDRDFSSFVVLGGEFVKQQGDGQGFRTLTVYNLNGGVFTKGIDVKTNAEGDTEQAVRIYTLKFANALSTIR